MQFYENQILDILEYTAVFAVSDFYAIELMNYFQQRGIHVPEDIYLYSGI